jgi:hypothetical protein
MLESLMLESLKLINLCNMKTIMSLGLYSVNRIANLVYLCKFALDEVRNK